MKKKSKKDFKWVYATKYSKHFKNIIDELYRDKNIPVGEFGRIGGELFDLYKDLVITSTNKEIDDPRTT